MALQAMKLQDDKLSRYASSLGSPLGETGFSRLRVWANYRELTQVNSLGMRMGQGSVASAHSAFFSLDLCFADPHAHKKVLRKYLEDGAKCPAGFAVLAVITALSNA